MTCQGEAHFSRILKDLHRTYDVPWQVRRYFQKFFFFLSGYIFIDNLSAFSPTRLEATHASLRFSSYILAKYGSLISTFFMQYETMTSCTLIM